MRLFLCFVGAVIASVVIGGLVLPREASAQDRTLTLFGRVEREFVPDGHAELAFNFYDKDTKVLAYRSVATAVAKDGMYSASLVTNGLEEGKEYYVLATLPAEVPESFQESQGQPLGIVLLQPSTPGIQQTGHVNISGTLIAGAIKTNAFQMSTGAASGRVLTSDASGNGTWQALPQTFWQASGSNIFYNAGNVGIGTSSPSYPLHVETGTGGLAIYGAHTATSGGTYGVYGQSASTGGRGVVGYATALTGTTNGVWGQSDSSSGTGVRGWAPALTGTTYGGRFESSSTSGIGVYGYAAALTGTTYGVFGQSNSTSGYGVFGWAFANSGVNYGGWFQSDSTDGRGVFGWASATNGGTYGVYGKSSSTSGYGVYGYASANIGFTYGVYGESDSTLGTGVLGYASATTGSAWGVSGRSSSTDGRGVNGVATATSGPAYGVFGQSDSTAGKGVYGVATATSGAAEGVFGQSDSTAGRGVYGSATATSGTTYGVYGQSASPSGYGVYGLATASSGTAYGVFGQSASTLGTGVYGYATATSGTNYGVEGRSVSTEGRGVVGMVTATSGVNYGVFGESNSPSGYGVYSYGRFTATGTKSFQIDHPLSPETHYLNHFCTEGPEPYNAYRGNVVTDGKGYATITLPPYFESINRDPTYQLTVIDDSDDFVLAKVVREIQNNQFVIRTNKPGVKVSWEVKAVRNDRWVQEYGFETEQEKPKEHLGKYLHPELYGMPKEYGIHYQPDVERERMSSPGVVGAQAEGVKGKARAEMRKE